MSQDASLNLSNILGDTDLLAKEITNKWVAWKSARREAENRWAEVVQYVYATSTRETSNANVGGLTGDEGGWSHSTHLPKLTQIADNLQANYRFALFPNADWFKFEGESKESSILAKRRAAEGYLRTKHALNGFERVVGSQLLSDWILFGNCFAQVSYETHQTEDPRTGAKSITYAGPVLRRISPFDIVFNPLAASFENTPKIIRSRKTMGEFIREAEDNPDSNYDEAVVEKVKALRSVAVNGSEDDAKRLDQLQLDGYGSFSQYLQEREVELLTFYGDIYDMSEGVLLRNHVIVVVDRMWVLKKEPLNTWSGHAHIYHAGWRKRPDNLWAMGPLDNLVGIQYQINHLENAKADAMDQMITPTRVIVGLVDEEDVEPGRPGGVYRIPSGEGSVGNLAPDTTILNADFAIQNKMRLMEELAGSPSEALGIRTPGEKTAFEVNTLTTAASRNFQNRIQQFEEEFVEKLLNAELELAAQFLDGPDEIRGVDPSSGAPIFEEITKEDLYLKGRVVPRGARHFARQNQLMQNIANLQNLIASDPAVAQHFPSKRLAHTYEELLGVEQFGLVSEFGRIAEAVEAAQLQAAAAQSLGLDPNKQGGGEGG
jgi:hypothetical protein